VNAAPLQKNGTRRPDASAPGNSSPVHGPDARPKFVKQFQKEIMSKKIKMIALIPYSSKNISVIFPDPCEGFSEERQPCNKQIVQFDFHPIPQFFLI
jgi:hypothetical protein